MDYIILFLLAGIILYISYIMISSFLLQRQFNKRLALNQSKNSTILLKQASTLVVSVALFVIVLTNSSLLATLQKDKTISRTSFTPEDQIDPFYDDLYDKDSKTFLKEADVVGEVTLENNKTYLLIVMDEAYFLFDEANERLISIHLTP